jgi:DNA helicase HerA-like ATPase
VGLPLPRIGEEVGIVLSGASAAIAPIALRRDKELSVREEDIVVIVDPRLQDYYMLGVVRWITRYEPFLRRNTHNVYIEHPDALSIETVMPFTNAYVEIYGALCDNSSLCSSKFESNIYAPTPGSRVYKIADAEPLTDYLAVGKPIYVGRHKYSRWRLPLDTNWVNYHIGVFGATGTGKSRLVLKLAGELAKAGINLVIFDHSGRDYVPFAEKNGITVIDASEVQIDPQIFAHVISRMMGVSQAQRDAVEAAAMCFAIKKYGMLESTSIGRDCQDILRSGGGYRRSRSLTLSATANSSSEQEDPLDEFIEALDAALRNFNARDSTRLKLRLLARFTIPRRFVSSLGERKYTPRSIVEMALEKGIVVVDLSGEQEIEVKRGIVASVAQAGWEWIYENGREINLGLIVDEAQHYACEHCGASSSALEVIAREGRKWRFFIVVASQRITRDIKTSIRSNLGTVFFSKLQSTGDLQELAGYLDLGRVTEASLAMLGSREFYVAGLMNPLRRPILLRVDKVEL